MVLHSTRGSIGTPGLGLGPGAEEADTEVPGLSRQKAFLFLFLFCSCFFLPFKRVFKNRENQTKPQGFCSLPRASPRLSVSFSSLYWVVFFSFKHLHGLGVRLGWGLLGIRTRESGDPGIGDRHCFSVGVCCCRCPLPLLTSATELATLPPPSTFPCRVPVTDPKNVFVSLFVLFVVGFILVLVSVFF